MMGAKPGLSVGQREAWRESTHLINVWAGSVSAGKTFTWVLMMLHKIMTAPQQGDIVIMGYSLPSVYRNVFSLIYSHPVFAELKPYIKYKKNSDVAFIFDREVHIIGMGNSLASDRIRGMTILYAFVDEGTLMPEEVFKMLLTRLRVDGSGVFMTTNPGAANHYLYKDYIRKSEATDTYYRGFTMADNPGLPDGYVEQQERLYSGVFYKRFIQGLWVAAEGAVYETWDEDVMVTAEVPELRRIIAVGIDYGTNHPTAGYTLGEGVDGHLYVTHEWVPNEPAGRHVRLTDAQLADSLQAWLTTLPLEPEFIYADPAAASFRQELFHRGVATVKAKNQVVDGIRTVDSILNSGLLKVSTDCVKLIEEIPSYRWDDKAQEKGEDKPIKEADDHVDALRYAVYSSRHLWENLRPLTARTQGIYQPV